jgi:hypothetical protein
MHVRPIWASVLLLAPLAALSAQVQQWNARPSPDKWSDEAPAVSLWFERGSAALEVGEPVRVRFSVNEDAYVLVGRVDSDGRLQVLWPNNKAGRTYVRGGEEMLVRSRQYGPNVSFVAYERFGSGFVFAISSYEPLDLSRLQPLDFERLGSAQSFFGARYASSAQSFIEKFAPYVLYAPDTPYDFDVQYYSVNQPTYASAASLCAQRRYYGYSAFEDYNGLDSLCRGAYDSYAMCSTMLWSAYGFGYQLLCDDFFYNNRYWQRPRGVIAGGNPPGTTVPPQRGPNIGLIRQLQHPDTIGTKIGPHTANLSTPPSTLTDDGARKEGEFDHVYSIPRRVIDNLRRDDPARRNQPSGGEGRGATADNWRPTPVDRGGRTDDRGEPAAPGRTRNDEEAARGARREGRQVEPMTRGDDRPRYEPQPRDDPPPRATPRSAEPPPRESPRGDNAAPSPRSTERPQYSPPPRSEPRSEPRSAPPRSEPPRRAEPRSSPPPHQSPPVRDKPDKKP